jgi:hypothetical protein
MSEEEPTLPRRQNAYDEIIEVYLRDVDRSLIRENLKLSPLERLQRLEEFLDFLESAKPSNRG